MSAPDDAISAGEAWAMLRWLTEAVDELHGGDRDE